MNQFNHYDSGWLPALKSHTTDQPSFGTSGIGAYPNAEYLKNKSENAITFNFYGVANSAFDEGENGRIKIIYTTYNWRVSRIVDTFAVIDGKVDEEKFAQLPKEIKDNFKKNDYNKKYKIVHGVLPNQEFAIGRVGKKGTKYKGFWFYEEKVFFEEYYKELPIAISRAIKTQNVYGVSSGILAISKIKATNFLTALAIEGAEKSVAPAYATYIGALTEEGIDTSANNIIELNPIGGMDKSPLLPMNDVKDISQSLKIMLERSDSAVVTMFKLNQLLDLGSEVERTATEVLKKYSIRARAISGVVQQQKYELLIPVIRRVISIMLDERFGLMGATSEEDIEKLRKEGKEHEIIPEEIIELINSNSTWYDIQFNNEVEQISNYEQYEAFNRFLVVYGQLLQLDPNIAMAVDGYKMLSLVKNLTNLQNEDFMLNEIEYGEAVQAQQQMQQAAQMLEANKIQSETQKNIAGAEKDVKQSESQYG